MAKEYKRAVAVLGAVVIVGTIFGSHRSIAAERGKVEKLAYTQVNGGSIQSDLDKAADIAANLATLGEKYHLSRETLEPLGLAVIELRQNGDLNEKKAAFDTLAAESYAAVEQLRQAGLTEKDEGYVEGLWTELVAAAHRMSYDDYNAHAVAFNENILGKFPANALGGLMTGVEKLPVFEKLEEPQ